MQYVTGRSTKALRVISLAVGVVVVGGAVVFTFVQERKTFETIKSAEIVDEVKNLVTDDTYKGTRKAAVPVKASTTPLSETEVGRFTIAYGSGTNEVGRVKAGEGANTGPQSFAVDSNGDIVICDTVNQRLQLFGRDGTFVRSIPLGDVVPNDIAMLSGGAFLIYDASGRLAYVDRGGGVVGTIPIDESRWDSRGPLRIVGDKVYVRGSGAGDVLIARIRDGVLTTPTKEELSEANEGRYYGIRGTQYRPSIDFENHAGIIEISYPVGGEKSAHVVSLDEVLSMEFLGDNEQGHFFIKTESERSSSVLIAVSEFDADGNLVQSVNISGGDYDLWTIRQIVVTSDGRIVNMIPEAGKVLVQSIPLTPTTKSII